MRLRSHGNSAVMRVIWPRWAGRCASTGRHSGVEISSEEAHGRAKYGLQLEQRHWFRQRPQIYARPNAATKTSEHCGAEIGLSMRSLGIRDKTPDRFREDWGFVLWFLSPQRDRSDPRAQEKPRPAHFERSPAFRGHEYASVRGGLGSKLRSGRAGMAPAVKRRAYVRHHALVLNSSLFLGGASWIFPVAPWATH